MSLDIKGKEILKEAQFNKFRETFIESLMEKISMEGRYGADIRPLIEDTLKEEAFVDFINKITELIEKSKIEKDDCSKTAGVLIRRKSLMISKKFFMDSWTRKKILTRLKKIRDFIQKVKD